MNRLRNLSLGIVAAALLGLIVGVSGTAYSASAGSGPCPHIGNTCIWTIGCDCGDPNANPPQCSGCNQLGEQCGDNNQGCRACSSIAHGRATAPGQCGCEPPYEGVYTSGRLITCTCPNPGPDGTCSCRPGQTMQNGECRSCGANQVYSAATRSCAACPIGARANADHSSCVSTCSPGSISNGGGGCSICPANTRSIYLSYSMGACEPCPAGTVSSPGSTQCHPNVTLPGRRVGPIRRPGDRR